MDNDARFKIYFSRSSSYTKIIVLPMLRSQKSDIYENMKLKVGTAMEIN